MILINKSSDIPKALWVQVLGYCTLFSAIIFYYQLKYLEKIKN